VVVSADLALSCFYFISGFILFFYMLKKFKGKKELDGEGEGGE